MVGRGRCSQVLASFKIQFGGGTREARSTFAESLVALYLVVRTNFGEGGGQFDRRGGRGVLNSCARESKARTGRFLRPARSGEREIFPGAGFTSLRPSRWTPVFHFFFLLMYDVWP